MIKSAMENAKKEASISIAPPSAIKGLWPAVRPLISKALDEDMFTDEAMLLWMLQEDRALLFVAMIEGIIKGVAVATIEMVRFPICNIVTIGGDDFDAWQETMKAALTLYAEQTHCRFIVAMGARAWQRIWPDFSPGKMLYYKEIAA